MISLMIIKYPFKKSLSINSYRNLILIKMVILLTLSNFIFSNIKSFCKFILPQDEYLKQLANMRESYYIEPDMLLPYEVEWSLASVLKQATLNIQQIKSLLYNINKSLGEDDIQDTFYAIQSGKNITKIGLRNFINEFSLQDFEKLDIELLFKYIDQNKDDQIDQQEFIELFENDQHSMIVDQELETPQKEDNLYEEQFQLSSEKISGMKVSAKLDVNIIINLINKSNFILSIIKQIEIQSNSKKHLSQIPHPTNEELILIFELLDVEKNKYLTQYAFLKGLEKIQIYCTFQEVRLFYERYNLKGNGLLDISEFLIAFSSNEDNNEGKQFVKQETLSNFQQLLLIMLECEEQMENIRQYLWNINNLNLQKEFLKFDHLSKGYITLNDLKSELGKNNYYCKTIELENLMERYDKCLNGVISQEDFVKELTPKLDL